jgi:uracil-DNA glycosylase family 4
MDVREQLVEHLRFLSELGATGTSRDPRWRMRSDGPSGPTSDPRERPAVDATRAVGSPQRGDLLLDESTVEPVQPVESLGDIRDVIGDCTRCKLHALGRHHIVFGVGNPNADLMFIGEAPGHDEDMQGIPFVGRAGQLLTKIIEAINLKRDDVYIANVIKCRPPENRNPAPDEVDTCEPFLFRQVQAIRPKVIVALGTFAAQTLLRTKEPISRLRGRVFRYGTARLVPTFHPAFLLRSPERKRDVWEDMKSVRAMLTGERAGDESAGRR